MPCHNMVISLHPKINNQQKLETKMNTTILAALSSDSYLVLSFFATVIGFAFSLNVYYKVKEYNRHSKKVWFDNDTIIVSNENCHVHAKNMKEMKKAS